MDTLIKALGDTEDATIVKSAQAERVAVVAGTTGGQRQSGESRAWAATGLVD